MLAVVLFLVAVEIKYTVLVFQLTIIIILNSYAANNNNNNNNSFYLYIIQIQSITQIINRIKTHKAKLACK